MEKSQDAEFVSESSVNQYIIISNVHCDVVTCEGGWHDSNYDLPHFILDMREDDGGKEFWRVGIFQSSFFSVFEKVGQLV